MQSTIVIINLFGAVALLLFGLAQVNDGVTRAFGTRLRTALASGTQSSLRSLASGFFATIALQSSTAIALTVASFVERVLLGANFGTTVTAWIVATGIKWLSPLLILGGAWPVAFALTAGLAVISSSSLAVVVLVLSLASTGIPVN